MCARWPWKRLKGQSQYESEAIPVTDVLLLMCPNAYFILHPIGILWLVLVWKRSPSSLNRVILISLSSPSKGFGQPRSRLLDIADILDFLEISLTVSSEATSASVRVWTILCTEKMFFVQTWLKNLVDTDDTQCKGLRCRDNRKSNHSQHTSLKGNSYEYTKINFRWINSAIIIKS